MSLVDLLAQRGRNRFVRQPGRSQIGLEELEGRTLPAMFMPAWSTLAPQYKFLSELAASIVMSHNPNYVQSVVSPVSTQSSAPASSISDNSAANRNIESMLVRFSSETFSVLLQVQVGIVNQPGNSGGDSRGTDSTTPDTRPTQLTRGTTASRFDFSSTESNRFGTVVQTQEIVRRATPTEEIPVATTRTTNSYPLIYLGGGGIRTEEDQDAAALKRRPEAVAPPTPVPTPPAQSDSAPQDDSSTPAPMRIEESRTAVPQSLIQEEAKEERPAVPFELPIQLAMADIDVLSATVAAGLMVGCNWHIDRAQEEARRRNRFEPQER